MHIWMMIRNIKNFNKRNIDPVTIYIYMYIYVFTEKTLTLRCFSVLAGGIIKGVGWKSAITHVNLLWGPNRKTRQWHICNICHPEKSIYRISDHLSTFGLKNKWLCYPRWSDIYVIYVTPVSYIHQRVTYAIHSVTYNILPKYLMPICKYTGPEYSHHGVCRCPTR